MVALIGFRALQGIGGGGLIVGAQSIIADVVAPRDRGRYQGIFGAVFGVTSVVGPLLGGFFVDNLSWRWVFYVNLPVGVVALVVTAVVLPGRSRTVQHVIDYLGAVLIAGTASCLVLLTSLGGNTYGWGSAPIVGFGLGAVVLGVAFVLVERRAVEPVLPLHLFDNRVFVASSAIGFVVGFAMFGAITYLPQYMQVVQGVSPTVSGLRLLPMMAGLLVTSIGSGQLISRTGRYKIFPIAGTAVMAVGLYLLSRLTVSTPTWESSLGMFDLGVGIGGVMQVLVIAVQNSVAYADLGAATSGATFFRSIGGSFGTAIFGAIFSGVLTGNLAHYLRGVALPAGFDGTAGASPAVLDRLPPAVHQGYEEAFAASIRTVFAVAVPIAAFAFILTWFLRELPLRATAAAPSPSDTYAPTAIPAERSSLQEMERAVEVLARRENRHALYTRLAERADLELSPQSCWLLYRLVDAADSAPDQLAGRLGIDDARLQALLTTLSDRGLIEPPLFGRPVLLTAQGRIAVQRLVRARREALGEFLEGWSPEDEPEIQRLIEMLAGQLLADDRRLLSEASTAAAGRQSV
jgi:EmrB/QacA subfamily drug resistance transporter